MSFARSGARWLLDPEPPEIFQIQEGNVEPWKLNLIARAGDFLFVALGEELVRFSVPLCADSVRVRVLVGRGGGRGGDDDDDGDDEDDEADGEVNNMCAGLYNNEVCVAVGTEGGETVVISAEELKVLARFQHMDGAWGVSLRWRPAPGGEGDCQVVGSSNAWEVIGAGSAKDGSLVMFRDGLHDHNIPCVALHPTAPFVVSASIDGSCKLWRLRGELFELVASTTHFNEWGWSVAWVRKGGIPLCESLQLADTAPTVGQVLSPPRSLGATKKGPDDHLVLFASDTDLFLLDPAENLAVLDSLLSLFGSLPHHRHLRRISLIKVVDSAFDQVAVVASQGCPVITLVGVVYDLAHRPRLVIRGHVPVSNAGHRVIAGLEAEVIVAKPQQGGRERAPPPVLRISILLFPGNTIEVHTIRLGQPLLFSTRPPTLENLETEERILILI
jgi:hypothetical protein